MLLRTGGDDGLDRRCKFSQVCRGRILLRDQGVQFCCEFSLVDLLGNLSVWARFLELSLRAQIPPYISHTSSCFRGAWEATGERACSVRVQIHYLGAVVAG